MENNISNVMETTNSEFEFPLGQLPALVIENIARYLSNKDLAACCAVSRGMREAFDDDILWKNRYDSERAKYLMKTPCKVNPKFESPENMSSGLSAISQSRLGFMAEIHLWNNWRQGKYTKELIWTLPTKHHFIYGYRPIYNRFITNDYVASIFPDRIEILDVRSSPAKRVFKPIPVKIMGNSSVRIANDYILVLYTSSVQVIHLNLSTNQWVLKHSFFIDESETLLDDRLMQADLDVFKCRSTCTFTVVDCLIVGVAEDSTMHIWNFEMGVKIKEESCPVENAIITQMLVTASKDLILSIHQEENYDSSLLLAYSLSKFLFLPFREIVQGTFIDPSDYHDYRIFGNYVTVWGDSKLNVYDYQNCQVKLLNHPVQDDVLPQSLHNTIAFLEETQLKTFDPSTSMIQSLKYEYGIKDFIVISNRFVQVQRHYHEGWDKTNEILEITDCLEVSKKASHASMLVGAGSEFAMNRATSRYIEDTLIWHFW